MVSNPTQKKTLFKRCMAYFTAFAGFAIVLHTPNSSAYAANTLLELFQKKQAPVIDKAQPVPMSRSFKNNSAVSSPAPKSTVASVKVSGPKIYNYKPDKLVRIDFSKMDDGEGIAPVETLSSTVFDETLMDESYFFDKLKPHLVASQIMAEKQIAEALSDFYKDQQQLLWIDKNGATARAEKLLAFFDNAADDGLNPKDYKVEEVGITVDDSETMRLQKLANFEVAMSARALRYALDAGEGRVIANRLDGYHDLPRGRVKFFEVLQALKEPIDAAGYLHSFQPQSKWYQALKAELNKLPPDKDDLRVAADILIKPGQEHSQLRNVIAILLKKAPASYLNAHSETLQNYAQSEKYELELVAAIKDYQSLTGNTPDGVIGRSTLAALQGELTSVKRDRLIYSMERLRWLPHELGERYVFINQPAYRAYFYDKGMETQAMNIVIGSRTNQTYFFYNKIQTVVFNPSWGVPRSIIVNEMLPKIIRDTSYLSRNGYEVYSNGKLVTASSVNWSSVAAGKTNIGIRQKPGIDNSLGELKILFPNSHDIYMHDTPAKSHFKRDMRALSHGCIRLERPRDMAAAVLGKKAEDLKQYFGKHERGLKVPEPMPVYVAYFTAWLDEDAGQIRYYDDVYGRDSGLEKAFTKTSANRHDVNA